MEREEARLVLQAHVIFACEKANYSKETIRMVEDALDMAIKALSADMVEVVRCKDCKYRTPLPYVDKDTHEQIYDCGYNISAIWGEENGYCNHGKRKGGEDE